MIGQDPSRYERKDRWDQDILLLAAVVIPRRDTGSKILLIHEGDKPYENRWVLPPGSTTEL